MKNWLSEPLLHFLLIGTALFFFYSLQGNESSDNEDRIVVTEAHIDRLIALWNKKWQRLPTLVELEGLIEQQIREEVLYREALALGLDRNDGVVRRRLAQKIEFISADLAEQVEPTDADLVDFLGSHADKFQVPGHVSFLHVYFNLDKRGEHVQEDARSLLDKLNQPDSAVDVMNAGDPFMFGQQHEKLTEKGVARLFGAPFANELFALPVEGWHGPVSSGYGLHLVQVYAKTPSRQPELDEVRGKVREELLFERRRAMDQAFYQGLRQKYQVIIENAPETAAE